LPNLRYLYLDGNPIPEIKRLEFQTQLLDFRF
jgi:hypothetical protein